MLNRQNAYTHDYDSGASEASALSDSRFCQFCKTALNSVKRSLSILHSLLAPNPSSAPRRLTSDASGSTALLAVRCSSVSPGKPSSS